MLETKKVFIDTQSFVKAGLHFDGPAFKSFRKYCNANELHHISTSVVDNEVRSKIQLSVKDAISAIQNFRRKARILSSLDDEKIKGLFEMIPDEDIYKKSESVFDDFLNACGTETLDANTIDAEELLSLYFEKKPPFGDGKKKSEFPDAISMLTLESMLEDHEKIYVISEDPDLEKYCFGKPRFISVESLDKFLDIYTTHTNIRHEQVKQYFITNDALIKEKITEYLNDCEVYNASTWENAEVDDGLTVKELGEIEPSILYITDEESQITFDIDVQIEVTVTGPDFNHGVYDRESGQMYAFDWTSRTTTIFTTFSVEVFLQYEFIDGELVNLESDDLYIPETTKGIEVSIEENEIDWY